MEALENRTSFNKEAGRPFQVRTVFPDKRANSPYKPSKHYHRSEKKGKNGYDVSVAFGFERRLLENGSGTLTLPLCATRSFTKTIPPR